MRAPSDTERTYSIRSRGPAATVIPGGYRPVAVSAPRVRCDVTARLPAFLHGALQAGEGRDHRGRDSYGGRPGKGRVADHRCAS
jgi:hypothetical protein